MKSHIFCIVDVFAEQKYAGNQLAVLTNAGKLSDNEMQRIAKEMNYSETTFILSEKERGGGYDVRIFTPENELPFAGHPTLGTASVIQKKIIKKNVEKIVLNLKVGQIPVTFTYKGEETDILWMEQIQPQFGEVIEVRDIVQVVDLKPEDIDNRFPIEEVSTGVFVFIIPIKNLDAVKRAQIDKARYNRLIQTTQAKALLLFCPETYNKENDLNVRFFADYYGVPEDPATGSANGCLAAYLVKHHYFEKKQIDIRVEQGTEIGRPSLLYLRAEKMDGGIVVNVGGKVIIVAQGELV